MDEDEDDYGGDGDGEGSPDSGGSEGDDGDDSGAWSGSRGAGVVLPDGNVRRSQRERRVPIKAEDEIGEGG